MERPTKELEYAYGQYRLNVAYYSKHVQATMYDVSIRWPIMWSITTTKETATGMIELFKAVGYFDTPVDTNKENFLLID